MRQRRRGSRFLTKAIPTAGLTARARGECLERHAPRQPCVVGEIHHPHPAAANLVTNDVRTDEAPLDRFAWTVRGDADVVSVLVRAQQLRNRSAQPRLACARLVQEHVLFFGVASRGSFEHRLDALPVFRSHLARSRDLAPGSGDYQS